jgi:hypothetical protein
MHRKTSGDVLFHRLTRDELMLDHTLLEHRGRTARTLVKEGPLRLTLIALAAGVVHSAQSHDGCVFLLTVVHTTEQASAPR